jgi:hypothetical protein
MSCAGNTEASFRSPRSAPAAETLGYEAIPLNSTWSHCHTIRYRMAYLSLYHVLITYAGQSDGHLLWRGKESDQFFFSMKYLPTIAP